MPRFILYECVLICTYNEFHEMADLIFATLPVLWRQWRWCNILCHIIVTTYLSSIISYGSSSYNYSSKHTSILSYYNAVFRNHFVFGVTLEDGCLRGLVRHCWHHKSCLVQLNTVTELVLFQWILTIHYQLPGGNLVGKKRKYDI